MATVYCVASKKLSFLAFPTTSFHTSSILVLVLEPSMSLTAKASCTASHKRGQTPYCFFAKSSPRASPSAHPATKSKGHIRRTNVCSGLLKLDIKRRRSVGWVIRVVLSYKEPISSSDLQYHVT